MAELTQLESKLGEVMGLAQAAQEATGKVKKLVDDEQIQETLEQMGAEAKETEERCLQIADAFDGKKTAIAEQAKETRSEAREMMQTYLGDDADDLDGFEFLSMAEAGELTHVEIVAQLNEKAGNEQVRALVETVMPIQQRHVEVTRKATLTLASREDPNEPA
jgi:trehalose-6-phosphatase